MGIIAVALGEEEKPATYTSLPKNRSTVPRQKAMYRHAMDQSYMLLCPYCVERNPHRFKRPCSVAVVQVQPRLCKGYAAAALQHHT